MTLEEADFIGAMNMCDEISNEAYTKIMCHCEVEDIQPCDISTCKVVKAFMAQQPCEDCVSREAIRNVLIRDNEMNGYSDRTHNLMEKLFGLPSVHPQTGKE